MKLYFTNRHGDRKSIKEKQAMLTFGAERFKTMKAEAEKIYESDPDAIIKIPVCGGHLAFEFPCVDMQKEMRDLFTSMFKSGKTESRYHGVNGLHIEGFDGGITAYVTDGRAIYRKTFHGVNKDAFTEYYSDWNNDIGKEKTGEKSKLIPEMKAYFEAEKFYAITLDGKEFKKALRGVDAINSGKEHKIILSVHDGKFDLASWNELGSSTWQLDGDYAGEGAIAVNKKYLDGIKSDKSFEYSYSKISGIAINIRGEIDAVIMPMTIDSSAEFLEVMEYEYHAPENPNIDLEKEREKILASVKLEKSIETVEIEKQAIEQIPEKPIVIEKPIQEFKVAGVTFGNRQDALDRLTRYDPKDIHVYLVPESDNEYDNNAIAVYVLVNNTNCSYRLGYIPKDETSIAKNYIGKIPELKILDGDIFGARLVFEQIEPVIEQIQAIVEELKPVETAIEQKPELKLVKIDKPVEKPENKLKRQARKRIKNVSILQRGKIDPALLGWKGWTWNSRKLVWTKACK